MSEESVLNEIRDYWHNYQNEREDAEKAFKYRMEHLEQEIEDALWSAMETGEVTAVQIATYCRANYESIGNRIRNAKKRNGSYK